MRHLKWLLLIAIIAVAAWALRSVGMEIEEADDLSGHRGVNGGVALMGVAVFSVLSLLSFFYFVDR